MMDTNLSFKKNPRSMQRKTRNQISITQSLASRNSRDQQENLTQTKASEKLFVKY